MSSIPVFGAARSKRKRRRGQGQKDLGETANSAEKALTHKGGVDPSAPNQKTIAKFRTALILPRRVSL